MPLNTRGLSNNLTWTLFTLPFLPLLFEGHLPAPGDTMFYLGGLEMCSSQVKMYHNPLVILQQYITKCMQAQKQICRKQMGHSISNIFAHFTLLCSQKSFLSSRWKCTTALWLYFSKTSLCVCRLYRSKMHHSISTSFLQFSFLCTVKMFYWQRVLKTY